jgi:hypothetical protein
VNMFQAGCFLLNHCLQELVPLTILESLLRTSPTWSLEIKDDISLTISTKASLLIKAFFDSHPLNDLRTDSIKLYLQFSSLL